jgi:hypothetical protein
MSKFNKFNEVTYAAIYKDGFPMNDRASAETMDEIPGMNGINLNKFLEKNGMKDGDIPKGYISDVYDSFEGIDVKRQGWPMFPSDGLSVEQKKPEAPEIEEVCMTPPKVNGRSLQDMMKDTLEKEGKYAVNGRFRGGDSFSTSPKGPRR